nr:ABC transporter permease [Propionicimonas sp.]
MKLDRTLSVATKNLRQWSRDRQAMVGPMLIPLVLMALCGVLFGFGGDDWPIGLVNNDDGPQAAAFATEITELHSNSSPYFNVVTTDADEAQRLVDEGRLQLVITIPDGFDATLTAGGVPVLETQVFNINTDMMKNARLRLDRAVLDFATNHVPGTTPITITQTTTRPDDVWRRSFIANSAVILAIMVGAALNTANMVAREWERRTAKEIRLAPRPLGPLVAGNLIAGLVAGLVNTLLTLLVAVTIFGVRIPLDRVPILLMIGTGVAIACAGIGIAIGAWLRDYRSIQPLLMVTFAGSFFAAGGFSSVATLPTGVQAFDRFWPPSYVFEIMQAWTWMPDPPDILPMALATTAAALIGVSIGGWALSRRL